MPPACLVVGTNSEIFLLIGSFFAMSNIIAPSTNSLAHIVGLDGDQNKQHFAENASVFRKMRVTIHNTGAWEGTPHSDNHVTIFLILENGGAAQINMRANDGDRRRQLKFRLINYQESSSEIKAVVYELKKPVTVMILYNAIRNDWKLHQYLFHTGGSGCHFWKY